MSATAEPAIEFRDVTKVFRRPDGGDLLAVDKLSLDIAKGEIVAAVSYTHLTLPTNREV